jgi:hypothetical protein
MNSFLQSRNFLADAGVPTDSANWSAFRGVLDVVGVIGLVVILLFILLGLTMIPDFLRYMRIKSM